MVERKDYRTASEFDSAFDSEILFESVSLSLKEVNSEESEEFETYGNPDSTASNFDFEIFSESGHLLKEAYLSEMQTEFSDFSLAEDLEDSGLTQQQMWNDEISEFAHRMLHGEN